MRLSHSRTLLVSLFLTCLSTSSGEGQAMDRTMVPRGQLRLQAHPVFTSWDRRFGGAEGSSGAIEELGQDLTAGNTAELFPGFEDLRAAVRDLTGIADYVPTLGPTSSRVQQEMTSIDFGAEVGLFEWLTVGIQVPWTQTRTVVDVLHSPSAADLGLNPTLSNPASVTSFLASASDVGAAARAHADAVCASDPGLTCTNALDLAARTAAFEAGLASAYGATPFFPLAGATGGQALSEALSALNSELLAANLSTFQPLILASETLTQEGLALLPAINGSGIGAAMPLQTRQGLWGVGDIAASVRLRLLDNLTAAEGAAAPVLGYRVTTRFSVRFPTGTPEDPDVLLDIGTGDAQLDLEGGFSADIRLAGRIGLAAAGFYTHQTATTVTRRVAAPGELMAPATTRREVYWLPGAVWGAEAAPYLRLSSTVSLHAEYRFVHKRSDEIELAVPDPTLDPLVLQLGSGLTLHQVGGGLRYDGVGSWLGGDHQRPMEVHMRFLHAIAGGGGQAPKWTRVEAGLRLFRRLWGGAR